MLLGLLAIQARSSKHETRESAHRGWALSTISAGSWSLGLGFRVQGYKVQDGLGTPVDLLQLSHAAASFDNILLFQNPIPRFFPAQPDSSKPGARAAVKPIVPCLATMNLSPQNSEL